MGAHGEDELYALMHKKRRIRNISVIAASGTVGKSTVTNALVAVAGSFADDLSEAFSDQLFKAAGFSFTCEIDHESAKTLGGKHIINFIKSSDSSESVSSVALIDGAFVVVDCVEGLSLQTEAVLRQALAKSIRCMLTVSNLDICFHEHHEGEKAYNMLFCAIEDVNRIIAEHEDKALGVKKIYPEKGMVAFCSGLLGWGFTLSDFAKIYAPMHGLKHSQMMKKLWGENFFDSKTRKWTNKHTGSPSCKRGFVEFCFDPLVQVICSCMTHQNDNLSHMLEKFGVLLKPEDLKLIGEDLIKFVLQSWLPVNRALLDMAIIHLPSPTEAQKYRMIYDGPLSDEYTQAIKNCDLNGPALFYASEIRQASQTEKFSAFGRVISGRLEIGKKVSIASANNGFEQAHDIYVHSVHSTTVCLNNFSDIPCGNIVHLVGIAKEELQSNEKEFDACSIKARKYELKAPEHDRSVKNFRLQPFGHANKVYELPLKIFKRLHPHQLKAVQWLWGLHCGRKGGLFADDMGMGKTRTICSFLRGLFHSKVIKRAIIIVPKTIVRQWEGELVSVKLKTITQTYIDGKSDVQQELLKHVIEEGGILLTTYDVFKNSKDIICKEEDAWDYIFLDEAHQIKNQNAQVSKAFSAVTTVHRILMTGTPFQNEFKEFYALMNFCVPGLFGNEEAFNNDFAFPIERGKYIDSKDKHKRQSKSAAKALRAVINPFILRRTKKLLQAKGLLSNKYEMTVWLKLTDLQRKLYTNLMKNVQVDMKVMGAPLAQTRVARDICNHPVILRKNQAGGEESKTGLAKKYTRQLLELVPIDRIDVLECSCKVRFTLYLVRKLLPDFKLLIFTQSVPMLELLQGALSTIMDDRRLICMDGNTIKSQRDKLIKDFQAGNEDLKNRFMHKGQGPLVFLMTTGVGGVGLTLTAASRVIIVDPALNPVVDNQSVDRVFRYGQKLDVKIYRLISCGTIEEHIYRNQVLKGELSTSVTEKEQCRRGLAKEKKKVLTLPKDKDGFWVSSTHRELRRFNVDNFKGCEEDVKLVKQHELVASVSNHGELFSVVEENFSWECEEQSIQVNLPGPSYKKPKSDYISDRDDQVVFRLGKNPGTEVRKSMVQPKHKALRKTTTPAESKQPPRNG